MKLAALLILWPIAIGVIVLGVCAAKCRTRGASPHYGEAVEGDAERFHNRTNNNGVTRDHA